MEKLITKMGDSIKEKIEIESNLMFYKVLGLIIVNNTAIGVIVWLVK